jgi:hypothetical protein
MKLSVAKRMIKMSTNRNITSPPDMETSKYEPDLNKPKKPKPKPVKKAEFEMETETFTAKKGGKVGSASKRADGIAQRGKTRGKFV